MASIKTTTIPKKQADDLLSRLGPLSLASRLKRLGEQLQRDVSRIYDEQGLPFSARWFPVTRLLLEHSPLAITEISDAIGMTHVAVNQVANEMSGTGLLHSSRDKSDDRRRLISLSAKGKRTIQAAQPYWEAIGKCTSQLLTESDHDLLAAISDIEKCVSARTMYERVKTELNDKLNK